MIDGVEILAVDTTTKSPPVLIPILFAIVIALLVIGWVSLMIKNDAAYLILFALFGLIVGILVVVGISVGSSTEETQYKVIVNDSVCFNEFHEKYEIIEQEGKIYTIRERDISK